MSPSPSLKSTGNGSSTVPVRETPRDGARTLLAPILVDALAAAAMLSISRRAFHSLRRQSDFPQDVTVVLGPRCVRFRLEALHAFAASLVVTPQREYSWPPARLEIRGG